MGSGVKWRNSTPSEEYMALKTKFVRSNIFGVKSGLEL